MVAKTIIALRTFRQRQGREKKNGPELGRSSRYSLVCSESRLTLFFDLSLDQITDGCRSQLLCLLGAMLLHRSLLIINILSLHRQDDGAILTIDIGDFSFDFFAFFQHITG